jgi:hypothetical protein
MAHQSRLFLDIEMFAHIVHLVRGPGQHPLAPRADRPDGDQLEGGILRPHRPGETDMLFDIVRQRMWPSCQSPYISFPIDQYATFQGAGCPLAARNFPIGVVSAPLTYSTWSDAWFRCPGRN